MLIVYFRSRELQDILEILPGTAEYRLKQLEDTLSKKFRLPECPVSNLLFSNFLIVKPKSKFKSKVFESKDLDLLEVFVFTVLLLRLSNLKLDGE